MPTPSRRHFLAGAAGLALATRAGALAPSDTIRVGVVGTGGRARQLMKTLKTLPGVKITYLCDVWDAALKEAGQHAEPGAVVTKDAAAVFADKGVDAVLVGAPDHWHAEFTRQALAAGKPLYVEKPLTHSRAEGAELLKAAAAAKPVAVQVGMQQRSMPHIALARELVQGNAIGPVVKVTMSWNRNADRVRRFPLGVDPKSVDWPAFLGAAPKQEFDEYRFRNWRWFWAFGGGIFTDLMVHWVDVAHWVLDLKSPERAVSVGQFTSAKGVWETPDTVQTLLSYTTPAGPLQLHFEGTFSNARRGAHVEFMGTEGTIYVDRGAMLLTPERGKKVAAREQVLGTGARGLDFYDKPDGEKLHLENWLAAIRTGGPTSAPLAAGVASADAAHLANEALRAGGAAKA